MDMLGMYPTFYMPQIGSAHLRLLYQAGRTQGIRQPTPGVQVTVFFALPAGIKPAARHVPKGAASRLAKRPSNPMGALEAQGAESRQILLHRLARRQPGRPLAGAGRAAQAHVAMAEGQHHIG